MRKDNVQDILLQKGRELVLYNGADSLTARKLSDYSGYSVGTIYNQFENMDNFILLQNYFTLEDLLSFLQKTKSDTNPFICINNYIDAFITYILNNKNYWLLLFNFHLKNTEKKLPFLYVKKVIECFHIVDIILKNLLPENCGERKALSKTLCFSIFSISPFLVSQNKKDQNNKTYLCKILLNTFLSGISAISE